MSKYDNIIAIDPDKEKSGVAFLQPKTKALEVANLAFPALLDYLQYAKRNKPNAVNPWLSLWKPGGWLGKAISMMPKDTEPKKIAKDVGANHETGRKIIEMCKHYGIEVVQHAPLVKCWKGKDRKITHEELASITGLIGRTNQDARDAALLAWVFAGLPIRLKC